MSAPIFHLRPATEGDLPAVAKLAAALIHQHHRLDPQRFLLVLPIEQAYARFLAHELADADAVVLVAEDSAGAISGYAYGRLQPRDWNALLDACGKLHDVYVDEGARRHSLAAQLVEAMVARLEAMGAPRVLLLTAEQNTGAHRLFEKLGFRRTMIEMTRETGSRVALTIASPGDAREMGEVHDRAWRATYRGLLPDAAVERLDAGARAREWAEWLVDGPSKDRWTTLIREGGRVRGLACAGPSADDDAEASVAEIYAIYLDPSAWGRGLGRRLFEHVKADLAARGYREMTLWVLLTNARARAFYEHMGMHTDGAMKSDVEACAKLEEVRYRATLSRDSSYGPT